MTSLKSKTSTLRNAARPLLIVMLLLLISASLRFGSGPGPALAEQLINPLLSAETLPVDETHSDQNLSKMLVAFRTRETAILEREAILTDREGAMRVAKEKIDQRLAELRAAEASLEKTMVTAKGVLETDIANLTSVYESMKPKEAAALFSQMAPDFAAGFLGRMRPDSAADLLAGLEPQVAYAISVHLAGRHVSTPRN